MVTGPPAVAGDGFAVHLAQPPGLADAAPLGDVLQDGADLPGVEVGAEQRGALALGEAGLAAPAPGHAAGLAGAVAAGHGQVSGAALAVVGAAGIQAAEEGQVVHGAVTRLRSLGPAGGSVPPHLKPIWPDECNKAGPRGNIYDGTWTKTPSMGWMFVPLTEYQGGGAAATIEPLDANRNHYEARLANLLGAGVQACYRGPRLYDTEATRAVVKRWVDFYKAHRRILDSDLIHLRRANGRDWDGWLHVDPQGSERAMAFLYNPLTEPIEREVRLPLHYAGLSGSVRVSIAGGPYRPAALDTAESLTLKLAIPARGRTWVVVKAP